MSLPLSALLLTLANPLPSGLPGPVSFSAPPQVGSEGPWMAQKQAGALAPSLQGRPVVVDIYASWCPACRTIAPTLRSLQQSKAGKATFVTFDVSDAATLKASRERARTLGLSAFLEANRSQTSLVAVLDPRSGTTVQTFRASTDAGAYAAAIGKAQAMIRP
ncbi:thioredoxin domain-containing protein [Cyanobium sp. N5-Cardenillas]|uniref:thioredoxin domain-containing protein n=1 Tax=Cyanobium sp. N5-Cardenillas TaxID=2823720 RepID=UPI0039658789